MNPNLMRSHHADYNPNSIVRQRAMGGMVPTQSFNPRASRAARGRLPTAATNLNRSMSGARGGMNLNRSMSSGGGMNLNRSMSAGRNALGRSMSGGGGLNRSVYGGAGGGSGCRRIRVGGGGGGGVSRDFGSGDQNLMSTHHAAYNPNSVVRQRALGNINTDGSRDLDGAVGRPGPSSIRDEIEKEDDVLHPERHVDNHRDFARAETEEFKKGEWNPITRRLNQITKGRDREVRRPPGTRNFTIGAGGGGGGLNRSVYGGAGGGARGFNPGASRGANLMRSMSGGGGLNRSVYGGAGGGGGGGLNRSVYGGAGGGGGYSSRTSIQRQLNKSLSASRAGPSSRGYTSISRTRSSSYGDLNRSRGR